MGRLGLVNGLWEMLYLNGLLLAVVCLPALVLTAACLWHRWVRSHVLQAFMVACALVVALESFGLFSMCRGTHW